MSLCLWNDRETRNYAIATYFFTVRWALYNRSTCWDNTLLCPLQLSLNSSKNTVVVFPIHLKMMFMHLQLIFPHISIRTPILNYKRNTYLIKLHQFMRRIFSKSDYFTYLITALLIQCWLLWYDKSRWKAFIILCRLCDLVSIIFEVF